MSASTTLRIAGFMSLLSIGGESLSFNPQSGKQEFIEACVNRNIIRGKDFFRQFGVAATRFDQTGLSEIEILLTEFEQPPQTSDIFIDQFFIKHRIRIVTQTDITYVLFCTPFKPA
jgi:hypothetical protein